MSRRSGALNSAPGTADDRRGPRIPRPGRTVCIHTNYHRHRPRPMKVRHSAESALIEAVQRLATEPLVSFSRSSGRCRRSVGLSRADGDLPGRQRVIHGSRQSPSHATYSQRGDQRRHEMMGVPVANIDQQRSRLSNDQRDAEPNQGPRRRRSECHRRSSCRGNQENLSGDLHRRAEGAAQPQATSIGLGRPTARAARADRTARPCTRSEPLSGWFWRQQSGQRGWAVWRRTAMSCGLSLAA